MPEEVNEQSRQQLIKIKLLLNIFITFFLISPVTFGGGFAIIPVVERAVVSKRRWMDEKEIADIFTVAQSIPGAVGVNSAIYLGYRLAGISGALAAMFGIVIPSFTIILILTIIVASFKDNPYVVAAFKGIKPVVVALIAYAGYRMSRSALKDIICWVLVVLTVVLLLLIKNLNIFCLIIFGAVAGIIICKIKVLVSKTGKGVYSNEQGSDADTEADRKDGKL